MKNREENIENTFLNDSSKEELVRNIKSICDYYYDLFKTL